MSKDTAKGFAKYSQILDICNFEAQKLLFWNARKQVFFWLQNLIKCNKLAVSTRNSVCTLNNAFSKDAAKGFAKYSQILDICNLEAQKLLFWYARKRVFFWLQT